MAQAHDDHTARILIVDDHVEVREGVRDLLLQRYPALQIETAADAEQALDLAARQGFEVVLMDIALPGMSGLEAISQMSPLLPAAQFLVVSIHDGQAYRDSAMAAGAAGFVTKRCLRGDLLATFSKLLDRSAEKSKPMTGAVGS